MVRFIVPRILISKGSYTGDGRESLCLLKQTSSCFDGDVMMTSARVITNAVFGM